MKPVGGTIFFKIDGQQFKAKGEFTLNPGKPKRDAVMGQEGLHGYTEKPQAAGITGTITYDGSFDMEAFLALKNSTLTVDLITGKTFVLSGGVNTSTGDMKTNEGEMDISFIGESGSYI